MLPAGLPPVIEERAAPILAATAVAGVVLHVVGSLSLRFRLRALADSDPGVTNWEIFRSETHFFVLTREEGSPPIRRLRTFPAKDWGARQQIPTSIAC